ncbi:uncharacterized protein LOC113386802 [Ctenocephalides felis]|uniref:uncharacterized protein LOC113386802 n=1 Tax=Ctenocephalides felis TaxID=7515 RepID=UPI000E6E32DC|nr:uncharacterized protein LOC113386802 [Ctenocephalides felis]
MDRLRKKSNLTKNIKPGMVSEFTSFVDKTKELTELLQTLKDGYANDQAKLESMRREISYMAHLKRKAEKPQVIDEPGDPTLHYQSRLSRTGLCPAVRRIPNQSCTNNKPLANTKKPVFKATLSCLPCRPPPVGKSESARMWIYRTFCELWE